MIRTSKAAMSWQQYYLPCSRGVFMITGGWARRPFDVAPDRTFDYDGKLFLPDEMKPEEAWAKRIKNPPGRLDKLPVLFLCPFHAAGQHHHGEVEELAEG